MVDSALEIGQISGSEPGGTGYEDFALTDTVKASQGHVAYVRELFPKLTVADAAVVLDYARFILPLTLDQIVQNKTAREDPSGLAQPLSSMHAAGPYLNILYTQRAGVLLCT